MNTQGYDKIETYEDFEAALREMKRMEDLQSKAPCLARLDALAAWSAKDDEL